MRAHTHARTHTHVLKTACAQTLERSYLLRVHGKIIERPQHMLMRVAGERAWAAGQHAAACMPQHSNALGTRCRSRDCPRTHPAPHSPHSQTPPAVGIHLGDIDAAVRTYHLLSERWFTHASPTLFNAGTPRPQLSSCFLVCSKGDSIEGIYDTLKECAVISKSAGGIGVSIHNIRATGSYIRGTNGTSNGIVPMLRVFNDTARWAAAAAAQLAVAPACSACSPSSQRRMPAPTRSSLPPP